MIPPLPPFPACMFPHSVTITRQGYTDGQVGGSIRSPATTTATQANVQLSSIDRTNRIPASEGDTAGSESTYDVSFSVDPTVTIDDSIAWQGIDLIVQAPALSLARMNLWRVRCIART